MAERETLSYERYLLDLVTRGTHDRQQKRIQRLLRQSRIPAEKALSNFNLKRLPPKVALLTKSLIEGDVLDRRDNVLAFGNPGSGKTHLLCVMGQELIARGRRMYFTTAALLVQDLLVAKRDLKLSRLFGVNYFFRSTTTISPDQRQLQAFPKLISPLCWCWPEQRVRLCRDAP